MIKEKVIPYILIYKVENNEDQNKSVIYDLNKLKIRSNTSQNFEVLSKFK